MSLISCLDNHVHYSNFCPQQDGCYTEEAKSKTYSVSIKSNQHENQKAFEETEYFKTIYLQ
jgi:hypothetical protein